jgi:hypothetical protein
MNSTRFPYLLGALLFVTISVLPAQQPSTNAPSAKPPVRVVSQVHIVTDAPALPVTVSSTDPAVRYVGRFDLSAEPMAAWSASSVVIKFHGTDLNALLSDDKGRNVWQIEVDGQPTDKLLIGQGKHLYRLATGLSEGDHLARLVKATEIYEGTTQFLGFQLSAGGALLPAPVSPYRLEVIGDSISCGAAVDGKPGEIEANNVWENAYESYGEVTARRFGADYVCIAYSGRKLWPDNTVTELYDEITPVHPASVWDFSKFIPQAVIISLSTNDFGKKQPNGQPLDQVGWVAAYEKFIGRLRGHYPAADIYCASSPMLTGQKLTDSKACLMKIASDLNAAGDAKVHYLELPSQDHKDGIGGAYHPNAKTHQLIADVIVARLTQDLGWQPVSP